MTLTRKSHRAFSCTIAAMTYNQPEMIQALSDELYPYLLVIDNGSNPSITSPARTPHSIIGVPENRYFAGGWNYAMELIDSDWVVMLNDDITGINIQMIDALIEEAEEHSYAVISPTFNSPHAYMQPHYHGQSSLRQVHSIDWVAAIIRKEAWNAVEGFNAGMFPGYGSDLDISYRLRQQGYRLAVDDQYVIHHIGGAAAVAGGTQYIQGNVERMNAGFQILYGVRDWVEFTQKFLLDEAVR